MQIYWELIYIDTLVDIVIRYGVIMHVNNFIISLILYNNSISNNNINKYIRKIFF
jgi:hypothetical protein